MMMTSGAAIVVLLAVVTSDVDVESRPEKRNIIQFCDVIQTYTGRLCLDYNDYGCFCGLGSKGSNPVDAIDTCCQQHDRCYAAITFSTFQSAQTVTYDYTCGGGTCHCNDASSNQPEYDLCHCDLKFGQCLHGLAYTSRKTCN